MRQECEKSMNAQGERDDEERRARGERVQRRKDRENAEGEQEKREEEKMKIASENLPNRDMVWWARSWCICVDNGSIMKNARGGRKVWRAAPREVEQVGEETEEEKRKATGEEVREKADRRSETEPEQTVQ